MGDGNTLFCICAENLVGLEVDLRTTPVTLLSTENLSLNNMIYMEAKILRAKSGPQNYYFVATGYDLVS